MYTLHIFLVIFILVNERAGSLSSLGLDVLTKPNELSAQCALASGASLEIGARSVSLLGLVKRVVKDNCGDRMDRGPE
jgi:hypothetical protein